MRERELDGVHTSDFFVVEAYVIRNDMVVVGIVRDIINAKYIVGITFKIRFTNRYIVLNKSGDVKRSFKGSYAFRI